MKIDFNKPALSPSGTAIPFVNDHNQIEGDSTIAQVLSINLGQSKQSDITKIMKVFNWCESLRADGSIECDEPDSKWLKQFVVECGTTAHLKAQILNCFPQSDS